MFVRVRVGEDRRHGHAVRLRGRGFLVGARRVMGEGDMVDTDRWNKRVICPTRSRVGFGWIGAGWYGGWGCRYRGW